MLFGMQAVGEGGQATDMNHPQAVNAAHEQHQVSLDVQSVGKYLCIDLM